MRTPSAVRMAAGAAVLAAATLGLAACGSTDTASTVTRSAAPGTSCPVQSGSKGNYITFVNDLNTDVVLDVPRSSWTCDGYSGAATPGRIDGRTIGPGVQPRTRMEQVRDDKTWQNTEFTLKLRAGNGVLVSLRIGTFPYSGGTGYRWGMDIDGKRWCESDKAVVEFRDVDGKPAWAMLRNACERYVDAELLFTTVRPA